VRSLQSLKTSVVLLHHPMTNRLGKVITTAVTNIDLHDIARSCRTYEVDHFFVVTPIAEQHALLNRIIGHWSKGRSLDWHPDRAEAFSRLQLVHEFNDVLKYHQQHYGLNIEVVMPDARPLPQPQIAYADLRARWANELKALASAGRDSGAMTSKIIVFGTGWGVAPEFI
jgi:hypothetical protein